jgi:hypothetical protein
MKVYLAVEYTWKRVGGVFSTEAAAARYRKRVGVVEPNLMYEARAFEVDAPIGDEEARQDWTG